MPNKWLEHLKQFRKKNPSLSMKAAMKGASKTWKKAPKAAAKTKRGKKKNEKIRNI